MPARSISQLARYIGKPCLVRVLDGAPTKNLDKAAKSDGSPGMEVGAIIRDVRIAYNREDVLLEPVAGEGSTWCSLERVRVVEGGSEGDADDEEGGLDEG